MKNNKTILIGFALIATFITSCSSDDDDTERGNWIERSVFDGTPRSSSISFTIDNKGYTGTGYDGDDYLSDFWEYDIAGNYWSQKADFPGTSRSAASSFAINNKGYIGTGYDGDVELSDFWEYNTETNSWTQKADFAGGLRREAIGFGFNEFGYIGTGYDGDNDRKDFWKYDPATDQWSELVGFGGGKRRGATTFTLDNRIYLGTGISNGQYEEDFWSFNPATELWAKKKDLDYEDDYYIKRADAVGFSLNGKGYIVAGTNGGALGTVWEYHSSNDSWEQIKSIEATPRQDAISFSNGNRALVLLGRTGNLYLDDNFELFPQEDYNEDD